MLTEQTVKEVRLGTISKVKTWFGVLATPQHPCPEAQLQEVREALGGAGAHRTRRASSKLFHRA